MLAIYTASSVLSISVLFSDKHNKELRVFRCVAYPYYNIMDINYRITDQIEQEAGIHLRVNSRRN